MTNYFNRENVIHLDGTRIFHTKEDVHDETEVSEALQQVWQCQLWRFGALSPIDWYATRLERVVGLLELKKRSHASGHYPTVFLNVRKWLALNMATVGLGVPSIFVVRFTDRLSWVPLNEIDASQVRLGGGIRRANARTDIEPVIEVPVSQFKTIA